MTLDSMNRQKAMDVIKMFWELEDQVSIRKNNIFLMRKHLKNYNPKYQKNIFLTLWLTALYVAAVSEGGFAALYFFGGYLNIDVDTNPIPLLIIIVVYFIFVVILYLMLKKLIGKRRKKRFLKKHKGDYDHWKNSLDNDIQELNIIEPAIKAEYNKYNVSPRYRSGHAMQSLYEILKYHSTMTVLDAMKQYDADERARSVAEARREAGERISNAISEESSKTRKTIDENNRKNREIMNETLGRLNDIYFYG